MFYYGSAYSAKLNERTKCFKLYITKKNELLLLKPEKLQLVKYSMATKFKDYYHNFQWRFHIKMEAHTRDIIMPIVT